MVPLTTSRRRAWPEEDGRRWLHPSQQSQAHHPLPALGPGADLSLPNFLGLSNQTGVNTGQPFQPGASRLENRGQRPALFPPWGRQEIEGSSAGVCVCGGALCRSLCLFVYFFLTLFRIVLILYFNWFGNVFAVCKIKKKFIPTLAFTFAPPSSLPFTPGTLYFCLGSE